MKKILPIVAVGVAGFIFGAMTRQTVVQQQQPAVQQQQTSVPCATAWIEWVEDIQTGLFEPNESFKTKDECTDASKGSAQKAWLYKCFPETFDPRRH
jgi:hypothetical protein